MAANGLKTVEDLRSAAPDLVREIEAAAKQQGISEATPKPATLADLRAKFSGPEDSAFVLGCLEANLTLAQATEKRNATLLAEKGVTLDWVRDRVTRNAAM